MNLSVRDPKRLLKRNWNWTRKWKSGHSCHRLCRERPFPRRPHRTNKCRKLGLADWQWRSCPEWRVWTEDWMKKCKLTLAWEADWWLGHNRQAVRVTSCACCRVHWCKRFWLSVEWRPVQRLRSWSVRCVRWKPNRKSNWHEWWPAFDCAGRKGHTKFECTIFSKPMSGRKGGWGGEK